MPHRRPRRPTPRHPEALDGWLGLCETGRVDGARGRRNAVAIRFTPVLSPCAAETRRIPGRGAFGSDERGTGVDRIALTRRSLGGLGLGGAVAVAGTPSQAQPSGAAPASGTHPGPLAAAPTSQAGLGPRLTLHAIDNAHGTPGAGLVCDLSIREGDLYRPIKTVTTTANGRPAEPLLVDDALKPGRYEVLLHVGAYFAALGVALPSPNFLDRVPIRFQIRDPRQRYHLPVLFTPWGYSYYRGS